MKIQKTHYSGNGHNDNIAYIVTDNDTTIWLPALNKNNFVDECYNTVQIEEGDHLYSEAVMALKNDVSFESMSSLEDALKKQKEFNENNKNVTLDLESY